MITLISKVHPGQKQTKGINCFYFSVFSVFFVLHIKMLGILIHQGIYLPFKKKTRMDGAAEHNPTPEGEIICLKRFLSKNVKP